jgi:uncharacterized membrane protein
MGGTMYTIMLFLHVVGATLLGFYLLLPFMVGRVTALSGSAQQGFIGAISTFNRVGQFSLIAAFITGGAMIGGKGLAVSWMIITVVLFLALGAFSGILGANMKKLSSGQTSVAGKVKTLSWISAIVFIGILYVMVNRW